MSYLVLEYKQIEQFSIDIDQNAYTNLWYVKVAFLVRDKWCFDKLMVIWKKRRKEGREKGGREERRFINNQPLKQNKYQIYQYTQESCISTRKKV